MTARKNSYFNWKRLYKKVVKFTRSNAFKYFFILGSLSVLFLTTVYWSALGAIIQSSNADQLANTYLLENEQTINGALLPAQHTFLLKIPLFWLLNLFGNAPALFILATILLSLLTVAGIALILWRIEKRPLVLGTILLTLSAVLLFIPAQSYPGSLLPANYAMLTTRNIEYLLFIGALILFIKAGKLKSPYFIFGALAFTLLFVSDRLFLSLGAATAIISGVYFFIMKRRDLVRLSTRVLLGVVAGYVGTIVVLAILKLAGLHFDSGSAVGPYGLVQGPKNLVIAIIYAITGVFTNLGANPAYDATAAKDIPLHLATGVLSPAGFGYVITIIIAVLVLRALVIASFRAVQLPKGRKKYPVEWQVILPVLLTATSIGTLGVFIVSNHYYPADSRYLAIFLPSTFIALAVVYRKTKIQPSNVIRLAALCLVGILFGILFQLQNFYTQNKVMGEINRRDTIVAAALKSHPVSTLLGNYWRVLPIKLGSPTINVTPLSDCTTPRQVLSSTAWQPDLNKTSFAYILRLDGSLADFPNCSLDQVTGAYGRPDSSIVIAGTRTNPKELLLFFDEGIHFLKTPAENNTPADTVKPISIDSMPFTTCPTTTIMQFVAHEDDDILFMNPDLTHDIKAGNCIRTVFFTAGDAGSNQLYWLGRQKGAEEAYNTILGTPNLPWTERVVSVDANHTITVANPRGNHRISLIFLHLPDGNPSGTGFASTHYESLRKLYTRSISTTHTVDNSGENFTYGDLTSSLTHLMNVYKPAQLRSQSTYSGDNTKDHSDHNAVGEFTGKAYEAYKQTNPDASMTYYLGYPVHDRPANVEDEDYNQKVSTFLSFGRFDAATCHSLAACNNNSVYGIYLGRQYTYPY